MSLIRARLPANLRPADDKNATDTTQKAINIQNAIEANKALAVKLLKVYIVQRLGKWNSTPGQIMETGKQILYMFGLIGANTNSDDIMQDCSNIKTRIQDATKYSDYINLLDILFEKAIKAKESEVRYFSGAALRSEIYFCLINIVYEILAMGPELAKFYIPEIESHRQAFDDAETALLLAIKKGQPREQYRIIMTRNMERLIFLGDRRYYSLAIKYDIYPERYKKIFSSRFKDSFFFDPDIASANLNIIKLQMDAEQGGHDNLLDEEKPNANLPELLQPQFVMIFCNRHLSKSLGFITREAIEEYKKHKEESFFDIYKANQEEFIAKNTPDNLDKRLAANPHSPSNKDHSLQFIPQKELIQQAQQLAEQAASLAAAKNSIAGSSSVDSIINNNNIVPPPNPAAAEQVAPVPPAAVPEVNQDTVPPPVQTDVPAPSAAVVDNSNVMPISLFTAQTAENERPAPPPPPAAVVADDNVEGSAGPAVENFSRQTRSRRRGGSSTNPN